MTTAYTLWKHTGGSFTFPQICLYFIAGIFLVNTSREYVRFVQARFHPWTGRSIGKILVADTSSTTFTTTDGLNTSVACAHDHLRGERCGMVGADRDYNDVSPLEPEHQP